MGGPNSRFRIWLCNQIKRSKKKYNDPSVSPAIRQTLLHWFSFLYYKYHQLYYKFLFLNYKLLI
jgi:hypothetical protein